MIYFKKFVIENIHFFQNGIILKFSVLLMYHIQWDMGYVRHKSVYRLQRTIRGDLRHTESNINKYGASVQFLTLDIFIQHTIRR